jgi:hypothetical protein
MFNTRHTLGALSAAVLIATASCATHVSGPTPDPSPASQAISVVVANDNFLDVVVYALGTGAPFRLGTVSGLSRGTFSLPAYYSRESVNIMMRPIGGSGRASSGPVLVQPGDTLELQVPARMGF